MHQLDKIEDMLVTLTANLVPAATNSHVAKEQVAKHTSDLIHFMTTDRKIEAIKAYRQLTGASLVDSKNAIESVMCLFAGIAR
mgnify:CR=1 FL=1